MGQSINISQIKQLYPDEWVLLGNPDIDEQNQEFLAGEVIYHSPDKKEVCYLGKPMMAGYNEIALFFNRVTKKPKRSTFGLFKRISQ
jgi:hypothetical protein